MINYSLSYRNTTITNSDGTKTKKSLAYAKAQDSGQLSLTTFAELATEKSVYGSGVLAAVIGILAKKIIDYAKNSYRVTVGDIGVFGVGLSSAGVEDINTFTPSAHIKKAYVKLTRSASLAKLTGINYHLVSTNAAKSAVNKSIKNAATTVLLGDSAAKTKARQFLESQD